MQPETFAALYRRVSTDKQDDSLKLQEKRVLDYCAFKQFATCAELTYEDPDTSGRIPMAERAGGRVLLARLRLGDVKHLVIAKLDRLGRNVHDALEVLQFLRERGITLHITDLGGETISTQGHIGNLILTILLAVAEWEVNEIRDRTKKQMKELFERGALTGNVPFGFDCRYTFANGSTLDSGHALSRAELGERTVVRKQLVDNPAEQEILCWLAQRRAAGLALNQLAREANALGYVTKLGRPWSTGSVDSVLHSRHTQLVLATTRPSSGALLAEEDALEQVA